jgi:hypothetical protein
MPGTPWRLALRVQGRVLQQPGDLLGRLPTHRCPQHRWQPQIRVELAILELRRAQAEVGVGDHLLRDAGHGLGPLDLRLQRLGRQLLVRQSLQLREQVVVEVGHLVPRHRLPSLSSW